MRFKIDENLPVDVASLLRDAGYDADTVVEEELGGAPDESLADRCQAEDRVVVTLDLDFANIRAYPPAERVGIIVLRLANQRKPHVMSVFRDLIPQLAIESPNGRLWMVTERGIRIYPAD